MATVREIAGYLEERVPSSLKLDFDNVGLLCGFPEREVSRVLVVLDITQQAIEEALSLHAELIVSHHPVIFTPLRRVCTDTPDAKRVIALLQGNLSAVCLHTNLDALEGGVNTALANAVGGEELEYTPDIGCFCRLPEAMPLSEFLAQIDGAELGLKLIEGGHFATENVVMPSLAEMLRQGFAEIDVCLSRLQGPLSRGFGF